MAKNIAKDEHTLRAQLIKKVEPLNQLIYVQDGGFIICSIKEKNLDGDFSRMVGIVQMHKMSPSQIIVAVANHLKMDIVSIAKAFQEVENRIQKRMDTDGNVVSPY